MTSDRVCVAYATADTPNSQYISTPGTPTTDREFARLAECTSSEYESEAPTPTSNRVCELVTSCARYTYERTEPTPTSNRNCGPATECEYGVTYASSSATAFRDTICSTLTTCLPTEFEAVAPNFFATRDRVCDPISDCPNGVETPATSTTDAVCSTSGVDPAGTSGGSPGGGAASQSESDTGGVSSTTVIAVIVASVCIIILVSVIGLILIKKHRTAGDNAQKGFDNPLYDGTSSFENTGYMDVGPNQSSDVGATGYMDIVEDPDDI